MIHAKSHHRNLKVSVADSLRFRPDEFIDDGKTYKEVPLTPISDLELMILNGWGDTKQTKIPSDWRTHKNPNAKKDYVKATLDLNET
jgi:hypothetical protein